MDDFPTVQKFYINSALYSNFYFGEDEYKDIFNILYTQESVDCYCPECKNHSVFTSINNIPRGQWGYVDEKYLIEQTNLDDLNIVKEFACSRNSLHRLSFLIRVNNKRFVKIGQFPSLADIETNEIKKYRKVLGEDYYSEFSKAIGLFAHGIGVGSYVYLRRIIENFIVKPSYERLKTNDFWDEEKYQKSRVKDKIELLKADLPDFLVNNSSIYSIVSNGLATKKRTIY